ncbi:cytochrome P450 [Vallicoccus soli]|uniref:Cytochrome P450 n=1 Tax=Vallicoccus soli TaxID=2339232 RepID=A0A3A3YYR1_9ACTN|nr:cytochrome P450 [Vallicoccus soli]RJK94268.1 cytochrome P450 [Vallicoccus soli]
MPAGVQPVPTLRGAPVLGAAPALRRDVLGTLERAHREHGAVVRLVAGPPGWRHVLHGVFSPEGVEQVLVDGAGRTSKRSSGYEELRAVLGDGVLTSEGERWRRQRRAVAPALTRRRTTGPYAAAAVEEAQRVAAEWEGPAASGRPVDVHRAMVGFTARFVGRVLLGADVADAVPRLMAVAPDFNREVLRRGQQPHPVPRSWPTPANRRLAAAVAEQRDVVDGLLAQRLARGADGDGGGGEDLLGLLLQGRARGGEDLDDRELADQVLVFLLAGHETTATALALALVELARSPRWQGALQDEVDAVLGDRPPGGADLPRLVLAERVVREVLRLYPSAPAVPRLAPEGLRVCGHDLPPGATVVVSPWVVHRDPALWPHPLRFDPSRFEAALPGGHRCAWFPFGAGPRACVGMQLALAEAVLALATLLRRYRLSTHLDAVPLVAGIALRPDGPLPVRVHRR